MKQDVNFAYRRLTRNNDVFLAKSDGENCVRHLGEEATLLGKHSSATAV